MINTIQIVRNEITRQLEAGKEGFATKELDLQLEDIQKFIQESMRFARLVHTYQQDVDNIREVAE